MNSDHRLCLLLASPLALCAWLWTPATARALPSLSCEASPPLVAIATQTSFLATWQRFRVAVEARDLVTLQAMTSFPLEVRGPDDAQPTAHYAARDFSAVMRAVLAQPCSYLLRGQDPAHARPRKATWAAFIALKCDLGNESPPVAGVARVANLEFRLLGRRWLLKRVYSVAGGSLWMRATGGSVPLWTL